MQSPDQSLPENQLRPEQKLHKREQRPQLLSRCRNHIQQHLFLLHQQYFAICTSACVLLICMWNACRGQEACQRLKSLPVCLHYIEWHPTVTALENFCRIGCRISMSMHALLPWCAGSCLSLSLTDPCGSSCDNLESVCPRAGKLSGLLKTLSTVGTNLAIVH